MIVGAQLLSECAKASNKEQQQGGIIGRHDVEGGIGNMFYEFVPRQDEVRGEEKQSTYSSYVYSF